MGETLAMNAPAAAEFDQVAQDYRAQHAHSTGVSVEALDYFASYKIEYVQQLWRERGRRPRVIMDFGAGIGNALAPMHEAFPEAEIIALDVSRASLDLVDAQAIPRVRTLAYDGLKIPLPEASLDCVFIACVFHHIPAEHHVARGARNEGRSARRRARSRHAGRHALLRAVSVGDEAPWRNGDRHAREPVP
jgi:ubiquinone/menaquinone biosynthesis C-methylase UbiE